MQLDSLQIELRPRNHWEALDLGCLLVRRWWRVLYLSWLITALPVFALLSLLLFDRPLLAVLLFWWLKPIYERAPLLILSRAIFGETPDLRAILRQLPGALRVQMLQRLTLRRLAPSRAFDTPVDVLENLTGERRQRRLAVLQRSAGAPAFWLTVIGVHVEVFLQISLALLAVMLIPNQVDVDWWTLMLSGDAGGLDWVSNLAYFLAALAVGPVYVAAGFTLYLNRRIELEGWDIELRFRELARRVAGTALIVLAVLAVTPQPIRADTPEDPQASKAMIEDILDGEDFNQTTVTRVPRFLKSWFEQQEDEEDDEPVRWDLEWLSGLGTGIAHLAEIALWLGVAILAVLVARWIMRYRGLLEPPAGARRRVPAARIQTLDLDAEELRDDPFGTARAWWQDQRHREALSLVYRAMLVRLRDDYGVAIEPGDTEGDCLDKSRATAPGRINDVLAGLTRTWLAAGYAHRLPTEEEFLALAGRCAAVLDESHPGAATHG